MKILARNKLMFNNIIDDMYNEFNKCGELAITYEKPFQDKTLKQLGFFFSAIVDSIIRYYAELGEEWTQQNVKENFYQACSKLDERLRKTITRFNGEQYEVPLRLSEMNREQASLFIDRCLWLIDNARCFENLVLHPSIRYTWILHITKDDLYNTKDIYLPRNDKEYLEVVRKEACICCGIANRSQVHHLKFAGMSGTGYKIDDPYILPLCPHCHLNITHTGGQDELMKNLTWLTKHIDIIDFCRIKYLRWKNKL